ncbi:hypothetical protein MED297_10541 [Reinekea sp. MED297]|uniref:Uncharacterized protein n=1 Tax=Reinekea blandensis MED297 TaxID=314283 RepID=A4BAI6_9GAMM|nr:hypothetical protein MED297_10541 [Reinekea sp. MED297] [Reinekea blandensis MED297]
MIIKCRLVIIHSTVMRLFRLLSSCIGPAVKSLSRIAKIFTFVGSVKKTPKVQKISTEM